MPSYSIIITRDITESCFTHVEADSEAEAREAAMEWLAECDDPGWRVDDGSCGTSPAYITDCTEESNPMTTATQHEADQAAITAACEAGVCDHAECKPASSFTSIYGPDVTPRTRSDLRSHPAFCGLSWDTSGNPVVWLNHYECECGETWEDEWSCGCDDDCPACSASISPYRQDWLAANIFAKPSPGEPGDPVYDLWAGLPEADSVKDEMGKIPVPVPLYTGIDLASGPDTTVFTLQVSEREFHTILAALRYWQDNPSGGWRVENDIATNEGQVKPLDNDEIDDLCERINCC